MAKIPQKNEKNTAFGGLYFVLDKFDAFPGDIINNTGIKAEKKVTVILD